MLPGRPGTKLAALTVVDERLDFLTNLFKPKKTTHTKMELLLPSEVPRASADKGEGGLWNQLRVCDGFLHVVRNFMDSAGNSPTPEQDFWSLEEEMILDDLGVAEKRIERLEADRKKGKKDAEEEPVLIEACMKVLGEGRPLRNDPVLANEPALRGFTFLSAKPLLVVINNEDEDEAIPQWIRGPENAERLVVRGRLEMELAEMNPEEAEEFREAYHIRESALDLVIRQCYRILDRITFFTVISDEVRAWPVPTGIPALEAAGAVHSDIKRGFIRAEVVSYEDLSSLGSMQECKRAGKLRLEGKDYPVQDGDIIQFRFNI